jgi:arylsulfatase A-like enzyme
MNYPLNFVVLLTLLAACSQTADAPTDEEDRRPNFLVIITDDMGFTDLGAFGGRDIRTPILSELANAGIRFTNFHGHLSCAPARAMLISGTGNHEAGLGTQTDVESFRGQRGYERYLTDRVATLPEVLRDGGYRTYLSGKWGLGGPDNVDPASRGFDKSFALIPNGGGHYETLFHDTARYSRDGEPVSEPEEPVYSTTLFVNSMIGFFDEDTESDRPFFALLTPTAPHWPLHYPPGMEDAYTGTYSSGYDTLRAQRVAGATSAGVLPAGAGVEVFEPDAAPWDSLSENEQQLQQRVMEIYAAMTEHLDSEIGRLLRHLEGEGALDNTLILIINDNGAQGGDVFGGPVSYGQGREFDNRLENIGAGSSWANMGQGWADAVTAPFRDGKASVYEGGLRVPAFAYWTGVTRDGSVERQLLTLMDVMPTLLELAGAVHPAPEFDGRQVLPMRGRSFAGLLRGENVSVHGPAEAIALSSAGQHFMYRGDWKILKMRDSDWELYNLAVDPYERHNLAEINPDLMQDMLAEFQLQAARSNIRDR